jgi:small conductance mechanosensitive channel
MDPTTMGETAQQAIDTIVSLVSNWGLQVLGAIAVLIIGRWVAALVRRGVTRSLGKTRLDESLHPFFASAAYYVVLAAVVIAVLSLFGIETTSLIALVGAAGLAVGLALQGTLSNFSAGVMLLAFRPFRVGNFVEVGGAAGTVAEIGVFSTILNTPDNIRVIIPNGSVFGEVIKNYSANDQRRVDLVIGISYGDDIGKAIDIVRTVLDGDNRVLADPAPTIAVAELGDSSVNLVVRPWCDGGNYWPLRFDLTRSIKEELELGGCSIPFPQRDLHVISMPAAEAS